MRLTVLLCQIRLRATARAAPTNIRCRGGALDAPCWISHRSIDPNVGADIIRPPISQCQMGPITYIYVLCENHFDFHRADNIRPYVQISNNVKRRAQGPSLHYLCKRKEPDFRLTLYVGVTYLPGQSPAKYCRRKRA